MNTYIARCIVALTEVVENAKARLNDRLDAAAAIRDLARVGNLGILFEAIGERTHELLELIDKKTPDPTPPQSSDDPPA